MAFRLKLYVVIALLSEYAGLYLASVLRVVDGLRASGIALYFTMAIIPISFQLYRIPAKRNIVPEKVPTTFTVLRLTKLSPCFYFVSLSKE